ncbi:hypothetical protein [Nocardia sp. NPDC057455]|uniref:hypothetical protein n=1 Tax=Nocardia sp. NPDC057455 TaxID=3346138 RepID=UPI003671813B
MRHTSLFAPPGDVPCCLASVLDPTDCTCWRRVVAPHPTTQVQAGPSPVRGRRCGDCAYRPDSPERQANDGDRPRFVPEHVFYCHDGLPKTVAWVHPSGAVRMADEDDDYAPIIWSGRVWQADGRPALVCAGWAADNRGYYAARDRPGTPR